MCNTLIWASSFSCNQSGHEGQDCAVKYGAKKTTKCVLFVLLFVCLSVCLSALEKCWITPRLAASEKPQKCPAAVLL